MFVRPYAHDQQVKPTLKSLFPLSDQDQPSIVYSLDTLGLFPRFGAGFKGHPNDLDLCHVKLTEPTIRDIVTTLGIYPNHP